MNSDIKSKFGLLINYLLTNGVSCEFIDYKVIHDPYFLFFENNKVDTFMSTPIEDIVYSVFGKRIYINHSKPVISEFIWAGEMYITLLCNYNIPIQRSFLICPLIKMINLFNPYHEMHNSQLCNRYIEDENKRSIFRLLIKNVGLTVRKLSYITGINPGTLLKYIDNNKLYSMPVTTARKICEAFDVPLSTISKESNYVPDIQSHLKSKQFNEVVINTIVEYVNVDYEKVIANDNDADKEFIKQALKDNKIVINPLTFTIVKKVSNRQKYVVLSEKEKLLLRKKAIKTFKPNLQNGMLMF